MNKDHLATKTTLDLSQCPKFHIIPPVNRDHISHLWVLDSLSDSDIIIKNTIPAIPVSEFSGVFNSDFEG